MATKQRDDKACRALGIDIGGAHIKLANSAGEGTAWYFPMWSAADQLAESLRKGIECFCRDTRTAYTHFAVTMTGEMADCFETRTAGVAVILQQMARAVTTDELHIYSVDGDWLSPESACQRPWDVAASNWHALAQWIALHVVPDDENLRLVLDVGSTTVDVIPIVDGRIATTARCDSERLRKGQLVYTGVGRTAIAAVLASATIGGVRWPLVAERFATSDDAYLALGIVAAEERSTTETADGRPRTRLAARARLARMLGEDSERLKGGEVESLARQVIEHQARQVAEAIAENLRALPRPDFRPTIVISGHGLPLARAAVAKLPFDVACVNLSERISASAARCAPAVAVARLLEASSVK